MKYCLTLLSACVLFTACKQKNTNDHLPPKVMQKLLMDVNMAETYSTFKKDSLHKQGTKNNDSLAVYYKNILAHYNLSPEQLEDNLDWYKEHPDELDTVYSNMIPIATAMQAAIVPAAKLPTPAAAPIALPGR